MCPGSLPLLAGLRLLCAAFPRIPYRAESLPLSLSVPPPPHSIVSFPVGSPQPRAAGVGVEERGRFSEQRPPAQGTKGMGGEAMRTLLLPCHHEAPAEGGSACGFGAFLLA